MENNDTILKRRRGRPPNHPDEPTWMDRLLQELNLTREEVQSQPSIGPQLGEMERLLKQSRAQSPIRLPINPFYYLQFSEEPEAIEVWNFMRSHHLLIKTKRNAAIGAVCAHLQIPPTRIVEIISSCCVQMGMKASAMVAALNHPGVVKATVDSAMTPEGQSDRTMLHKATGFLPTPKGSTTTVNVHGSNSVNGQVDGKKVELPSPEDTIRRLASRFQQSDSLAALPLGDQQDEEDVIDSPAPTVLDDDEEEQDEDELRRQ